MTDPGPAPRAAQPTGVSGSAATAPAQVARRGRPAGRSAASRPDARRSGALLALALVLAGGALVQALQSPTATAARSAGRPDPRAEPDRHADSARGAEVRRRFDAAVVMLHARQFEHAAAALHRVLELAPGMPEAHVNMGFALLGLKRNAAARDFFDSATVLQPSQANAYYGLALTWEADGDLPMALGAMRSYLHLARTEDDAHLRRARAALWEWETQLQAQRSPEQSAPERPR